MDLVIDTTGGIIPVEVKVKHDIKKRDAAPLFKFLYKYKARKGYIISGGAEATFRDEDKSVEVIPYWMYWTLMKKLKTER